jgi:hypothetical protein
MMVSSGETVGLDGENARGTRRARKSVNYKEPKANV